MANSSNIDEVITWLRSFVDGFDFTLPGKDQNLGRDLAHVGAAYIEQRSGQHRGADKTWAKNAEPYRTIKEKHYGWVDDPNSRTGQMLSQASLFGQTQVQAKLVEMRYGTGQPPQRNYSPVDNRTPSDIKADEAITDIEKAWFAHTTGDRPFYEADQGMEDEVIAEADRALADYILKFG